MGVINPLPSSLYKKQADLSWEYFGWEEKYDFEQFLKKYILDCCEHFEYLQLSVNILFSKAYITHFQQVVLDLLAEAMIKKLPSSKGFLIDGYPREVSQGQEFEKDIGECAQILYFEVNPFCICHFTY